MPTLSFYVLDYPDILNIMRLTIFFLIWQMLIPDQRLFQNFLSRGQQVEVVGVQKARGHLILFV